MKSHIGPIRFAVSVEATNGTTLTSALESVLVELKQYQMPEKGRIFKDPGISASSHRKVLEEAGFMDKLNWIATITESACVWDNIEQESTIYPQN